MISHPLPWPWPSPPWILVMNITITFLNSTQTIDAWRTFLFLIMASYGISLKGEEKSKPFSRPFLVFYLRLCLKKLEILIFFFSSSVLTVPLHHLYLYITIITYFNIKSMFVLWRGRKRKIAFKSHSQIWWEINWTSFHLIEDVLNISWKLIN